MKSKKRVPDQKEKALKIKAAKQKFRHEKYRSQKQEAADKQREKFYHKYRKVLRKEDHTLKEWHKKVSKLYEEDSKEEHSHDEQASNAGTSEQKTQATPKKFPVKASHLVAKRQPRMKTVSKFHKAEKFRDAKKEEKRRKDQEIQQKEKEKDAALKRYKANKKYQLLSKKNYKGQPNMANRMQLLLRQIEEKYS